MLWVKKKVTKKTDKEATTILLMQICCGTNNEANSVVYVVNVLVCTRYSYLISLIYFDIKSVGECVCV